MFFSVWIFGLKTGGKLEGFMGKNYEKSPWKIEDFSKKLFQTQLLEENILEIGSSENWFLENCLKI
jgi:hypothetical protein